MARRAPAARGQAGTAKGRPVMLATLDVPFDARAVTFAVDSAVELGQRLVVANFCERAPLPLSAMLGCDELPYPPQLEESLAAAAMLARSLGVDVTRLRVKSFHPIPAMLEVMAEEAPGIFVFGPDRARIPRFRYRRAVRAIRSRTGTLLWTSE
jgi:nucleotide-binding universal stress UspA family protein